MENYSAVRDYGIRYMLGLMGINLENKVKEARHQRTNMILLMGTTGVLRFPDTETAAFQGLGWEEGVSFLDK